MRAPTIKQMAYLDYLALELGYRTGREFARDCIPDEWSFDSVSRCITFALQKLARTATTQKGRDKAKAAMR